MLKDLRQYFACGFHWTHSSPSSHVVVHGSNSPGVLTGASTQADVSTVQLGVQVTLPLAYFASKTEQSPCGLVAKAPLQSAVHFVVGPVSCGGVLVSAGAVVSLGAVCVSVVGTGAAGGSLAQAIRARAKIVHAAAENRIHSSGGPRLAHSVNRSRATINFRPSEQLFLAKYSLCSFVLEPLTGVGLSRCARSVLMERRERP